MHNQQIELSYWDLEVPAYLCLGTPSINSVDSDSCFIRVSSVAQESLGSLLSGTNVQSGAITLARASAVNYLAKPAVRPLQTDLRIGNLLPTRSLSAQ